VLQKNKPRVALQPELVALQLKLVALQRKLVIEKSKRIGIAIIKTNTFGSIATIMKQTRGFRINTLHFKVEKLISCSNLTCEGRTIAGGGLVEQKLKERF